jgi:serine/threonine protein kinase
MHERSVICGDLSPANVILDEGDHIYLFDLEQAYCEGRPWSSQGGTPGFYPLKGNQEPSPERDLFAFGAILRALLFPGWYRGVLRQLDEGTDEDEAWDRPELPCSVAAPIRDLVTRAYEAHEGGEPISLNEIKRRLEEWRTHGVPTTAASSHQ